MWLILHYSEWEHLVPVLIPNNVYGYAWQDWKRKYAGLIIQMMKTDGVIAPTTGILDVNLVSLLHDAIAILKAEKSQI